MTIADIERIGRAAGNDRRCRRLRRDVGAACTRAAQDGLTPEDAIGILIGFALGSMIALRGVKATRAALPDLFREMETIVEVAAAPAAQGTA